MRVLYYFGISLFLLLPFSCQKKDMLSDGIVFQLNYAFTMDVIDHDFQIHFDELLEDSRCPTGSFCAWEGRARIKIITISDGLEKSYEFSTLAPIKMDTIFESGNDQYLFELSEINPYPDGVFKSPEDYSIAFNLKQL